MTTQGAAPTPDADSSPYGQLGILPDASFDDVQLAKQRRLGEVGDDGIARARIEAAYDAVLMERLKERQQGKVSSAALNASQREASRPAATPAARPSLPALPNLAALPRPSLPTPRWSLPSISLAEGNQRWLPIVGGGVLLLVLLLAPTAAADLVLAVALLLTVASLQRRSGRLLPALGWALLLLCGGLVLGALLVSLLDPALPLGLPLAPQQVQSLPALVLLVLGALLIG